MKYFLDTEFVEDGETIKLISIGIVAEDNRELYLQSKLGYYYKQDPVSCPNQWAKDNVLPHLDNRSSRRQELRDQIIQFCQTPDDQRIEFWADYCSYDWIVLCQIFGTMMDLPDRFPMFCNDIQQYRSFLDNPDLPEQKGIVHHALEDAKYCKQLWEYLTQLHQQVERDRMAVSVLMGI